MDRSPLTFLRIECQFQAQLTNQLIMEIDPKGHSSSDVTKINSEHPKFTTTCRITLNSHQETQLRRFLNLHHLGDEEVNYLNDDGILIPKYPEKETSVYIEAVSRSLSFHEIDIELSFDMNAIVTARIISL